MDLSEVPTILVEATPNYLPQDKDRDFCTSMKLKLACRYLPDECNGLVAVYTRLKKERTFKCSDMTEWQDDSTEPVFDEEPIIENDPDSAFDLDHRVYIRFNVYNLEENRRINNDRLVGIAIIRYDRLVTHFEKTSRPLMGELVPIYGSVELLEETDWTGFYGEVAMKEVTEEKEAKQSAPPDGVQYCSHCGHYGPPNTNPDLTPMYAPPQLEFPDGNKKNNSKGGSGGRNNDSGDDLDLSLNAGALDLSSKPKKKVNHNSTTASDRSLDLTEVSEDEIDPDLLREQNDHMGNRYDLPHSDDRNMTVKDPNVKEDCETCIIA